MVQMHRETWFLPAGFPFSRVLGVFWSMHARQKWIPNGWQMTFVKNDPGPLRVPIDVGVCRFEAHLGRFDSLDVPKSLSKELFWDNNFKNSVILAVFGCQSPVGRSLGAKYLGV